MEDGGCDVPPDNLGNLLRDPLLDANLSKAKDVLLIGFVLRIAVVCDLWFDGAVVGAGAFGGRSRSREHVSLIYVDSQLVVVERVADVARQSLHSVGEVFVQLSLDDALDLC